MLASITHRATGVGLGVGALVLAWWLVAISNGPEGYESFMSYADTPLGLLILFGFTWSLAFHFLNGIRHLAWDLGYGFDKHTANADGSLVFALSVVWRRRHLRLGLDRPWGISAMSSLQTPLHKVQGLGASHSGTGHFWRERLTAVALIPLSLWFAYAMLGLAGTSEVTVAAVPGPSLERDPDGRFRRLSRSITLTWACRW